MLIENDGSVGLALGHIRCFRKRYTGKVYGTDKKEVHGP